MYLVLVSVNGAPAVPYPADSLSLALGALSVAAHYLTMADEVTRLAVELVEDDGDDWRDVRTPDGQDATALIGTMLRAESRNLWLAWRIKTGAVVVAEARD